MLAKSPLSFESEVLTEILHFLSKEDGEESEDDDVFYDCLETLVDPAQMVWSPMLKAALISTMKQLQTPDR